MKNLINEKKARLAAKTSQTYRQELARRTGTNIITDDAVLETKVENLRIGRHEDLGGSDMPVENETKTSMDGCDTEHYKTPSTEELDTKEENLTGSNIDFCEKYESINFDCCTETEQEICDNKNEDVASLLFKKNDCEDDVVCDKNKTDNLELFGKDHESDDGENMTEEVTT